MNTLKSLFIAALIALTGCTAAATAGPDHAPSTIPAGDVRSAHFQRLGMF
ncbi:MAG: hypothetical protein NVSMB5_14500 [Candidatus Velthaea sp.]